MTARKDRPMTQTEQVAVGQETLEALIAEHGDIIVSAMGDGLGWRSCSPRGRWQALRLASTRPISNEEVRRLVERLRSATSELMYDDLAAVEQTCTALQHLSAESQGLRSALEAADRAIQHNHEQYQHLSAREAEAREKMCGLIAAWEVLPGNQHYSPARIEAWLSANMKDAVEAIRNWLKAGEA